MWLYLRVCRDAIYVCGIGITLRVGSLGCLFLDVLVEILIPYMDFGQRLWQRRWPRLWSGRRAPMRNDVGVDVDVGAASMRWLIHALTDPLCSVCGCVGWCRMLWRLPIFSMFCVWRWRARWQFHSGSKLSQLPAQRLSSCEGCLHQYGTGGSVAVHHA